jgi:hypothetical protein
MSDALSLKEETRRNTMLLRNEIFAAVLAAIITGLVLAGSALAQLSCNDVKYGNPDYNEKMDELAERAKLPENYWSRYHEDVVRDLCSGNTKDIDGLIDGGFVKPREAQDIARVLGKTYMPKKRSESGKRYGDARKRFSEMGACGACADNIAQYYTKKPDSPCGKLAKRALEGNPDAIKKLVAFPDFCQWSYDSVN